MKSNYFLILILPTTEFRAQFKCLWGAMDTNSGKVSFYFVLSDWDEKILVDLSQLTLPF